MTVKLCRKRAFKPNIYSMTYDFSYKLKRQITKEEDRSTYYLLGDDGGKVPVAANSALRHIVNQLETVKYDKDPNITHCRLEYIDGVPVTLEIDETKGFIVIIVDSNDETVAKLNAVAVIKHIKQNTEITPREIVFHSNNKTGSQCRLTMEDMR